MKQLHKLFKYDMHNLKSKSSLFVVCSCMRVGIPQFRISGVVVVFAQLLYIIVHNTTAHIQGFVAVMQNLLEIGFTCIRLTMTIVMFYYKKPSKYSVE